MRGFLLNGGYDFYYLYSINGNILCWFMALNVRVVALIMYLGTWAIVGGNIVKWCLLLLGNETP